MGELRTAIRVARLEGEPRGCRLYGEAGQKQDGIDIYSALPNGRYATYQCKRYAKVTARDITDAVDVFVKGKWSRTSDRFVLCCSQPAIRRELGDEIETQRRRLMRRKRPIEFVVWDAEELSILLKAQRDIVRDFFGPQWLRQFLPAAPAEGPLESPEAMAMLRELVERPKTPVKLITLDWAPEVVRRKLQRMLADDPDTAARLDDQIGNPPEPHLVATCVDHPPLWLQEASAGTWEAIGLMAQVAGEWRAASHARERVADLLPDDCRKHTAALVDAATAASQAGDTQRQAALLRAAEESDAEHPRVKLAEIPADATGGERLTAVAGLTSDDPGDLALIAAERALGQLLSSDVESAWESIAEVERHTPGSALAGGLKVSAAVQEGRLAVIAQRPLDREKLRTAFAEAQALRERLSSEKRWSESTRLLMLMADIESLLGDRAAASRVLRRVVPEELKTTDQKVVLASSAAERALDFELALELLEGAEETRTVRRLRLEANEAVGTPAERAAALQGLDVMIREGGAESPEAAFIRLAATLGRRPTPWSADAAILLKQAGHERAAVTAEAMYLARHKGFREADDLLRPYGTAMWALSARLRAAMTPRAPRNEARTAAEALLAAGPSHALRVDAGQGFARAGDFRRAREVLINVARDPGAPEPVRADAYDILMDVVGNDLDDWDTARDLHAEWTQVAPRDSRSSKWAPRIANRRLSLREGVNRSVRRGHRGHRERR